MNMNPEYRAELRQLSKARKKVLSDYKQLYRDTDRQISALIKRRGKGLRTSTREVHRIDRRIAILEGRMS
jgi:hypothetical protein